VIEALPPDITVGVQGTSGCLHSAEICQGVVTNKLATYLLRPLA